MPQLRGDKPPPGGHVRAWNRPRTSRAPPAPVGRGQVRRGARSQCPGALRAHAPDLLTYYPTEYDAEKLAAGKDTERYADLQNLPFKEGKFDVVIASDVFEHVRKDVDGYREVHRVLKDGGALVLTVPFDHGRGTIVRVDTSHENDVHLLEPEYHGGGGHTLAYRNYGRDLLPLLRSVGFSVCHLVVEEPEYAITRQSVIIGGKGDFVMLHTNGAGKAEGGSDRSSRTGCSSSQNTMRARHSTCCAMQSIRC